MEKTYKIRHIPTGKYLSRRKSIEMPKSMYNQK